MKSWVNLNSMKTRKGFYFQCGYFFGCRFNISWFGCYFWHFPDVSVHITLAKVCVLNFANFHSEFLEGPYGPVPYFGPVTEETLSCEFILFAIQIAIYNKKGIFFWEFLPRSGMKRLGRYHHPPSRVTVRERAKVWKQKFFTPSISHFAYILSIFFANFATFSSQDFFNL